ncbi:hypothetical protein OG891_40190 [Streptomyces sp. NBC_01637]|nr:hypothetical protein OH719_06670 [Streptomyces sp. NBC_01653]WTD94784.1 hypothetical protein OG891_40190 [Streptomyces sp. NBC_01637]
MTTDVAVLRAVGVVLRRRRRAQARSRFDEKLTVVIVLASGVLLAPAVFGQGVLDALFQLVHGASRSAEGLRRGRRRSPVCVLAVGGL